MRLAHQRRLIRDHVAAIPPSPNWRLHDLVEDLILPFDLLDPKSGKWYPMQFGLVGYNVEPPRLTVRHPEHGGPTYDVRHWPSQLPEGASHPVTGQAFCCVKGVADYHSHPLHADIPWDSIRNTTTLDGILASLVERLTPGRVLEVTQIARPL